MNAFLVTQQAPPQPGWALQYTPDLKPVGARTYEPDALVTHTTARNVELLIEFYRLTGDTKFLARVPEALDWLDRCALPRRRGAGRPHASDVHRDRHEQAALRAPRGLERRERPLLRRLRLPRTPLAHYSAFRAGRRRRICGSRLCRGQSLTSAALAKASPLATGPGLAPLPRYFAVDVKAKDTAANVIASLNARGLLAGAARLQQPSLQGRRLEDARARRLSRAPTSATRPTRRRTRIRS